MTKPDFDPCPFCGATDIVVAPGSCLVHCMGCGAIGPTKPGEIARKEASIQAWNKRAVRP